MGTGVEQVRFSAARPAPQAELRFTLTENQGLQAVDEQIGARGKVIFETVLTVERER